MNKMGSLLPVPLFLVLSIVLVVVPSCSTGPQTPASPDPVAPALAPAPAPSQETPPTREEAFDPGRISQEVYATTMTEVQTFINDLNRIIRARDYNAWVDHLSESYFREISSREFLEEKTEELYRRDQAAAQFMGRDPKMVDKKILRTARDYFDNVVVPSRSNDRVDDIDFVLENRVKAYTEDNRGNRLILYDLEVIDSKWKITS
ncbi:MAG: hypothetical protein LBH42_08120 [Treponema sp.]|jgi:hypothetical protein|nr:hypothetical protein [Treponema sp.]